jgi:histone acetyltransferase SAS3
MLTPRLAKAVMAYDWCCIECKTCEVCMVKGQDVSDKRAKEQAG